MKITFKVEFHEYDEMNDALFAIVRRVDANEEFEIYNIRAHFDTAIYGIEYALPERAEAEVDYAPTILLFFMRAFKDRYAKLDHTASPADVFGEELVFTLDIDA